MRPRLALVPGEPAGIGPELVVRAAQQDWEADLVNVFRNRADSREISGQRDTPTGPALYIAHPIRIESAACS